MMTSVTEEEEWQVVEQAVDVPEIPEDEPPVEEPPKGDPPSEDPPVQEPPSDEPASADESSAAGTLPDELHAEETAQQEEPPRDDARASKRAVLEAIIYITEEPLTAEQIALAMGEPRDVVQALLNDLVAEYTQPHHGLTVREVASGYQMATKAEHHEAVRDFVRNLKPALKLSLAALETLAVIAYKQPITGPEIMEIRGVQGAGVMKTLLDRKLITVAGRKNVVGKPMLYKTTKEFLIQFGLKNLAELPTLKEFEELRRMAMTEPEPEPELAPELLPEPEEGVPQTGNAEGDAEKMPSEPESQGAHAG